MLYYHCCIYCIIIVSERHQDTIRVSYNIHLILFHNLFVSLRSALLRWVVFCCLLLMKTFYIFSKYFSARRVLKLFQVYLLVYYLYPTFNICHLLHLTPCLLVVWLRLSEWMNCWWIYYLFSKLISFQLVPYEPTPRGNNGILLNLVQYDEVESNNVNDGVVVYLLNA